MVKAKRDYQREMVSPNEMKWDNTKKNLIRVGDIFSFVNNIGDSMQTHEVIGIRDCEERLKKWDIVDHQERTVILLSPVLEVSSFSVYKRAAGYRDNYIVRGTCAIRGTP